MSTSAHQVPPGRVGIPLRLHRRRQSAGLPFSGVSARALTILMYPPISRVGRTGTVTRSYGVSVKTRVSEAEMWYTVVRLSLIHISEPTRLGMISYAVFCLKKKKKKKKYT